MRPRGPSEVTDSAAFHAQVQHGGAPSTKYDRDRSELLRDEAEIQLELRHVHAATTPLSPSPHPLAPAHTP